MIWSIFAVVVIVAMWHPVLLGAVLAGFLLHFGEFGRGRKSPQIATSAGLVWFVFLAFCFYEFTWRRAALFAAASLVIANGLKIPVAMLVCRLRGY